jgi:hypothetical protein
VSWLHDAGISRERVTVLPQTVTNTYDEAKAARAFADRTRIDRLVVVTSAITDAARLPLFVTSSNRQTSDTHRAHDGDVARDPGALVAARVRP